VRFFSPPGIKVGYREMKTGDKTENRGRNDLFARELVSALEEFFKNNLRGVVLFGSRARGEGRRNSDWDVLILAEEIPENPVDRTLLLKDICFKKGIRGVSPIIRTLEEFEKSLRPLYLDIAWDGILLFDRAGYVSAKIKEIKEIVKKSDLKRVKRGGGWIWEWKIPPRAGQWEIEWER
jgi:predicted nucleotidyltransferase